MAFLEAGYRLARIDHCIVFGLVLVAKDVHALELVGDIGKHAEGFDRSRLRLIRISVDEELGCARATRITHVSIRIVVLGALGALVAHFILISF